MQVTDTVKQVGDVAAVATATTINIASLNEWVTLLAGVLTCIWGGIRIAEWANDKVSPKRRTRKGDTRG